MLMWLLGVVCGAGTMAVWSVRSRQRLWKQLQQVLPVSANATERMLSNIREYQRNQEENRQELATNLIRAEALLQHLPTGLIQVDAANIVVRCNVAAQQMFLIENWQPDTRMVLEWVRSFDLDELIQSVRQTQAVRRCEWVFYPAEGAPIQVRAWGVPLAREHVGVIVVDRREAVNLAQQRDRWASDVAHELKTPLTSIRLVAERLQMQVNSDLKPWVDRLLNEVIRLSTLVQDLLELSRLEMGASAALKIEQVDIVAILHRAWHGLEPLAKAREQSLQYLGDDVAWVWADEARLYRVIFNLLDNASKFSLVGGTISVDIELQAEQVRLRVRDRGLGFPPESLELVFERFYRTDSARDRSVGGTGLGLAIVRQIIEAHGGEVAADNAPDGGAIVQVQFPYRALKPD